MNVILEAFSALFRGKTFSEGLRAAIEWIFRQSPFVLRVGALLSFVVALLSGTVVWLNLSDLNSNVLKALIDPSQNQDVSNSVLESFFLSTVMSDLQKQNIDNDRSHAVLNGKFVGEINAIQRALSPTEASKPRGKKAPASVLMLDVIATSGAETIDPGTKFFLSDGKPGFLFVPGVVTVARESLWKRTGKSVRVGAKDEPLVFGDVIRSQIAADFVCGGLGEVNRGNSGIFVDHRSIPYLSPSFGQSYVIFRSGVARICEEHLHGYDYQSQRQLYTPQFSATTLLEDQKYFANTVKDTNIKGSYVDSQVPLTQFLHPTQLYVDRGGNGIVETFCRYFPLAADASDVSLKPTDAILCLDFPIKDSVTDLIQARIVRLGGTTVPVSCDETKGCSRDSSQPVRTTTAVRVMSWLFPSPDIAAADVNKLTQEFSSTSKGDRQEMTGQIKVRYPDLPSGDPALFFTIPLGGARLLAGKLDLVAYQQWSSLYNAIFAVAVVVTLVLIMMMFASYGATLQEQARAFHAVDIVMGDVPAPYARVGEDGRFARVNHSFARELGYKTATEALVHLKDKLYEDYLADEESKGTYARIKRDRREGGRYRSYRVNLWCGRIPGEEPIKGFEVHGWNVPSPVTSRNHPGASFGILLPLRQRVEEVLTRKVVLFTDLTPSIEIGDVSEQEDSDDSAPD